MRRLSHVRMGGWKLPLQPRKHISSDFVPSRSGAESRTRPLHSCFRCHVEAGGATLRNPGSRRPVQTPRSAPARAVLFGPRPEVVGPTTGERPQGPTQLFGGLSLRLNSVTFRAGRTTLSESSKL